MTTGSAITIAWIQARDDLLHLADDVVSAVGILADGEQLGRTTHGDAPLLIEAMRKLLNDADSAPQPTDRSLFLSAAGAIAEFCLLPGLHELLPHDIDADECDPVKLYDQALESSYVRIGPTSTGEYHTREERWRKVRIGHRKIRALRLQEKFAEARALADRPKEYFHRTPVEHYRAYYDFEWCAAAFAEAAHRGAVIDGPALTTWRLDREQLYRTLEVEWDGARSAEDRDTAVGGFALVRGQPRNRFDYACALAKHGENAMEDMARLLQSAHDLADPNHGGHPTDARTSGYSSKEIRTGTDGLSLLLARIEFEHRRARAEDTPTTLLDLIEKAVEQVERTPIGRRVIARSKGPLAIAVRRILGDLASMLTNRPDPRAGILGLQIGILAKRAGIATLIREQSHALHGAIGETIAEALDVERELLVKRKEGSHARLTRSEAIARFSENLDHISAVLSDWVFPLPVSPSEVIEQVVVSGRYGLDIVALGTTSGPETTWYRSSISPDGAVEFSRINSDAGIFTEFFTGAGKRVGRLGDTGPDRLRSTGRDWFELARILLPESLMDVLRTHTRADPMQLLLSPHGLLNALPWQALRIDRDSTALLDRAIVTRTPVLSSVTGDPLPLIEDRALVHLVSNGFPASFSPLDLTGELAEWNFERQGDLVSAVCGLRSRSNSVPAGEFTAALADCDLVHIAGHGDGKKLSQHILMPEPFRAADAVQADWPESVLLVACKLADDSDEIDEEPLGFAVAVLAGGARCVVAGQGPVDNLRSDALAARLIAELRADPGLDLARALRLAQLASRTEENDDLEIYRWASFSAFVR